MEQGPVLEQLRRELTDGAPDAIYTLDCEGRVLSANAAAAAVLGCDPEEIPGLSILDVIAPEDRERTEERIRRRFTSGDDEQPFIVDIVDRAGRRRTMEVTSRLIRAPGEDPRLEGFARDITDRKRAEDALRSLAAMTAQGRGEDFFRSMVRSIAEALGVQHVFVGQFQSPGTARIQTLAFWTRDRFADNIPYDLAGTPCEAVVGRDIVIYSDGVQERFPRDLWLVENHARSYVGLPLLDTEGHPIGLLALAHSEEFEPSAIQIDMLRILAARAGAEIDRIKATDALRASEQRFRQLAEQAPDILWAVDLPSKRLAYLSPSFERITGIATSEIRPHVRRLLHLIDSRDRRRVLDALRAALMGPGDGYALEYRLAGKDGTEHWIFDQGVIIRDSHNLAVRISGVARDVTVRKQTEIALAEERGRFRELFENSPDAIFVESFEGIVLDVNQAACELHRLPRERIIGRHVTDLAPEHLRQEVSTGFQRLASGDVSVAETLALRSDGTVVPVELRATRVVLHERRPALLLHARNIGARKSAEDFLAGQKRILEWIATGRPIEDILAELVRVTESRHHETRCWVLWFPEGTEFPPSVLAPSFDSASLPELAALAREDRRLAPWEAGADGGPTVIPLLAGSDTMARLSAIERQKWASAVAVPVVARNGRPLGAFTAFLQEGAAAAEAQLNLYRLGASLAGVAIERHLTDASLREGAARLHRANAALLELARSELVAHGDLGVSLQEITEAAARGIGVSRVNIWLFEENDTVLRCVSQYEDGSPGSPANLELRVCDFPSYFEAVTRDRFVSVADVQTDSRTAELLPAYFRPLGIASILNAGIRLRGRLIGMICLEHQGSRRTWKNEEELFAGSLADIIALAIQAGERRCIEEALRQSEEAYRSVVGALAEGVMLVNRDGSFVTFNDSAAEILGLTADYLRNHRLADVTWDTIRLDGSRLHPEEYPAAITLRTGEMVTDSVMGVQRPDGRLVWMSINSRPFSRDDDGQVSSVVVSFADISGRQQAERALREGHELLQAISAVQARFIEDSDPDRTYSHMLDRLIRMTDSQEGLIGEVIWAQDGTRKLKVSTPAAARSSESSSTAAMVPEAPSPSPSPDPVLGELLETVLETAQVVSQTHNDPEPGMNGQPPPAEPRHLLGLCLRHDEEVVGVVGLSRVGTPYSESMIRGLEPLLITCANLIGAMGIDRQREQAEAQIRHLNAELEQRVEDRTADLRSTNEELAEFAYVVTHDLKAPLRGIHQLSEWLTQDHASRLDAEGLRLLGLMRGRVKHLQRMIDGLLACARVARTPEPESSVSTLQMVREVAIVIAPPAHISIEPLPELPVVFGNPDRLYQVFQNLLDNAVKYLDKPKGRITVTSFRRRNTWEFRVADNGPGIPERYREKVFQIFQRLDPAGEIPGTGLGLTLVKRIVESRGGRIWIESEDGQGTTVCFTWPDRARRRAVT